MRDRALLGPRIRPDRGGRTTAGTGRRGRALVWLAFACGIVHAAFSLYWAFGGTWLLATVGEWAVALVQASPASAAAILGVVGVAKATAATIPVLVAHRRMPWPRLWRAVSWAGGSVLVVYGAANVAVSGAVLAGVLRSEGGYDTAAMVGHALLWDPLFLLWGAALLAWLWSSRPGRLGTGTAR